MVVRAVGAVRIMRPGDIQRYRLAALQRPLLNRLADVASRMDNSASLADVDVELIAGRAVATFLQAITPVVGPDNVPDFPRLSDFEYEPRPGPLFSFFAVDQNSYSSTQLLLTFDDLGLLSAGTSCEYYPRGALDAIMDTLSETIPSLTSYFAMAKDLLSHPPIKRLFDEVVTSYNIDRGSSDLRQDDFMRTQSMWFDAKTPAFFECVRLLLFTDESEWSSRISQLTKLPQQITLNPSLQLTTADVDQLAWGLSGAAPLFREDYLTFRTDVDWSSTSRAIRFAQSHNAGSRSSLLAQIRGDLRHAVIETASRGDLAAVQRAMLRNFLGQDAPQEEIGPDEPGGWT